jgi:hypothetical protein
MDITTAAPSHSFLWRAIGAALFRSDVYDEVKLDPRGTVQAALIVMLAGVLPRIANIIDQPLTILFFVALAIGFWAFETVIVCAVARFWMAPSHLQGKRKYLLRTLGFAGTPAILAAILFQTSHNQLFAILIGLWGLVASVIAVRQALGVSTTRAITIGLTAVIGAIDVAMIVSLAGLALVVLLIVG